MRFRGKFQGGGVGKGGWRGESKLCFEICVPQITGKKGLSVSVFKYEEICKKIAQKQNFVGSVKKKCR